MPPQHHDPLRRRYAEPPRDEGQPKGVDARDRADLMRITAYFAAPCFTMLTALWFFLEWKGIISGTVFMVLLVANIPLTALGIVAINAATAKGSAGLINLIHAAGDIAPPKSYPHQDAMIARGQYREAADYFRDHLTIEPTDNEARLRLATLLETKLSDDAGAEALYKEVRARPADAREELRAANGLIDLYRRTRKVDRLMVELARFAERYRGTEAGEAARRELVELKRTTTESPRSPT
jgi:hypothetical protein